MFDPQYYPYASRRHLLYGHRGMVASSHPLATQAGAEDSARGAATPWTRRWRPPRR